MEASTLVWLVVPGFATGLGGLGLLVVRRPSPRLIDTLLGTTAGIMLAAAVFSLLVPALAVGVAFAAGGPELGIPIAVAIGLQNIPEGFAAAAPLLGAGASLGSALAFAVATGLVEPPAALLGYAIAESVTKLLPVGLSFAAGRWCTWSSTRSSPRATAAGTSARRPPASCWASP